MSTTKSFMITNRSHPEAKDYASIKPLTGINESKLWWYISSICGNDPDANNYSSQSPEPASDAPAIFRKELLAQLKQQVEPSLTIFIHGLGNLWIDGVRQSGDLGASLKKQGYRGTVVGFSWPSYDDPDSLKHYSPGYAFPPLSAIGTIRGNIGASIASFASVLEMLTSLVEEVPALQCNFISHSEGNFMLMAGLNGKSNCKINEILLVAADINNAVLQDSHEKLTGQGIDMSKNARRVSVYYSASDPSLSYSVYAANEHKPEFHNPVFNGRLGVSGPSYNYGKQFSNVIGVDCSQVINDGNINYLEQENTIPAGIDVHCSYLYAPQISSDMTSTLMGHAAHLIKNRVSTANANSFVIDLDRNS